MEDDKHLENMQSDIADSTASGTPRPPDVQIVNEDAPTPMQVEANQNDNTTAHTTTIPLYSKKISLKIILFFLALGVIGAVVPNANLVTAISEIFLYIGMPSSLVIGIISARDVLMRLNHPEMYGKNKSKSRNIIPAHWSLRLIFVVLTFIASVGSVAIAMFIAYVFLAVRACELSGNSKCI